MNRILYLGGFGLAIALAVMAIIFFIVFRIPSVHRYFRKTSKKGLVAAAVVETQKMRTTHPLVVTQEDVEDRTEVLGTATPQQANLPGDVPVRKKEPVRKQYAAQDGATEVLGDAPPADRTEVLDKTEIL